MSSTQSIPSQSQPSWSKFITGGLAGMGATCIVQPIDLIKTRMQLLTKLPGQAAPKSSFHVGYAIIRQDGLLSLYNGLSAGLLRQAVYTTMRLGIYQMLEDWYSKKRSEKTPPSFGYKLLFGLVAGGLGAFVGTPTEVTLIRMTSDGHLPMEQRCHYKSAIDAIIRIVKEEGILTLWRGWKPTVVRAMVLNSAQLSVYSQSKQLLLGSHYFKDDIYLHFTASLISGFFSTVASIPVDMSKTRLQTMKNKEYSSSVDVLIKVIRQEGLLAPWKGFTPYFLRLGPHTILTFIFLENLNALWKKNP